jgi:hypothetical protein
MNFMCGVYFLFISKLIFGKLPEEQAVCSSVGAVKP